MNIESLAFYLGYSLCQGVHIESVIEPPELLVPYSAFWTEKKPNMVPFEAKTQEAAIQIQKDTIAYNAPKFDGWSSGMEGSITLKDGTQSDVLVVEGQVKGMSQQFQVLQLFTKSPLKLGDLIFTPSKEISHEQRIKHDFTSHFSLGISSHPQGEKCHKLLSQKT